MEKKKPLHEALLEVAADYGIGRFMFSGVDPLGQIQVAYMKVNSIECLGLCEMAKSYIIDASKKPA